MHGLDLLLTLGTCVVEGLVLLLDQRDLALDFLLPLVVIVFLSLLVLGLEFSDFLQFSLFLDFENGLLASLGQQDVQNWLHLSVIFKQIVISNLGLLVNASFLRHILGRGRLGQEIVSLHFHGALLGSVAALLSQKVGEVNLDTSWGSWSQIVRLDLLLRLLKFEQLLFDHFNLLFLALHFDALLLLLGWGQVLLQQVHVVGVSSEDTLIVHNVEGLAIVFLIIIV